MDGISLVSAYAVQWDSNGGLLNMELGTSMDGTRVDNFMVSTTAIPEPSVLGLFGVGGLLLCLRHRVARRPLRG